MSLRNELRKIVPFAELDKVRWKSLMAQVDDRVVECFKDLAEEFKVAFCLNPNVQYCNECSICKNVERVLLRVLGNKR